MKENLINHAAASDAKKIDLEDKLQKFTTQRDLFGSQEPAQPIHKRSSGVKISLQLAFTKWRHLWPI